MERRKQSMQCIESRVQRWVHSVVHFDTTVFTVLVCTYQAQANKVYWNLENVAGDGYAQEIFVIRDIFNANISNWDASKVMAMGILVC